MISIVIPARNEAAHLGATLAYLREHAPPPLAGEEIEACPSSGRSEKRADFGSRERSFPLTLTG